MNKIKVILIILTINLFSNCTKPKPFILKNKNELNILKDKLLDTLKMFSSKNEYLFQPNGFDYTIYITEMNKSKIGIIAISEKILYFYQFEGNRWVANDSIVNFDNRAFEISKTYLNEDSDDELLINGFPDMHGQTRSYVFMKGAKGVYKYRKDMNLSNISYDANTKQVRTYYESCAVCVHSKSVYNWVGDSLKLIETVELDLTDQKIAKTKYYKMINGKLTNYKTLNSSDSYDKALFDIDP